jgi:Protein of unknown function (DUF4199)
MRRAAVIFGGISGAIGIASIVGTLPFLQSGDIRNADLFGYATIVLSSLVVFFGIRSYREKDGAGRITFGQGLLVGVLITLVFCALFIVAFELVYFRFVPDYGVKYEACMVHRAEVSGGTPAEIEKARSQAALFRRLFDNPWTNAAVNFATTFPVGLAAAAISAVILRKR